MNIGQIKKYYAKANEVPQIYNTSIIKALKGFNCGVLKFSKTLKKNVNVIKQEKQENSNTDPPNNTVDLKTKKATNDIKNEANKQTQNSNDLPQSDSKNKKETISQNKNENNIDELMIAPTVPDDEEDEYDSDIKNLLLQNSDNKENAKNINKKQENNVKNSNKKAKIDYSKPIILGNVAIKEIKYRGPFSYRWIKIFGLTFLFLGLMSGVIPLLAELHQVPTETVGTIENIMNALSTVALPLIIISAFAIILRQKQSIRYIMILYGICALVIYLATNFIFERYFMGVANAVMFDKPIEERRLMANSTMIALFGEIINYNVFLDLFLCSVFFFFTNYTPKKLSGKKLIAFRCCAIIPVLYVIFSIIMFGLYNEGVINMSVALLAGLTCRSPATYVVFFGLSLFLASREKLFLKKGGTREDYNRYLKTNVNSFHVSAFCSILLAVVSVIEFIFSFIPHIDNFGFGNSYLLFLAIPFVMLMSYTRDHKEKVVDVFILLAFFFVLSLAFFDVIYQLVVMFLKMELGGIT